MVDKVKACYVLGLNDNCSKEDAKKAYKQLSLKVHPDKINPKSQYHKIATNLFILVQQAYDAIDPQSPDAELSLDKDNSALFGSYFQDKNVIPVKDGSFIFKGEKYEKSLVGRILNQTLSAPSAKRDCNIDYNIIFKYVHGNSLDEKYQNLKAKEKFVNDAIISSKIEDAYSVLKNDVKCSDGYRDDFLRAYFVEKNSGFTGYLHDLKFSSKTFSDDALKSHDPSRFFLRKAATIDEAFKNIDAENFSNKEVIKNCLRYHVYAKTSTSPESVCGRYTLFPEGNEISNNLESPDTLKLEPKFTCGIKISKVQLLHAKLKLGPSQEDLIKKHFDKGATLIDCEIDYFKILGLTEGSSSSDIETAASKLKSKFSTFQFLKDYVSKAYDVLRTEESRQNYLSVKNDYAQNKNDFGTKYQDQFLQKYFVEQNNGLKGAFNDVTYPHYLSMSDDQLKKYDIIRHTLKNNEKPQDAYNVFATLVQNGVDFSNVKKCLHDNIDFDIPSMELCGKYSVHQEGFEPYQ